MRSGNKAKEPHARHALVRHALVTGAASGIGRAVALRLAREGWAVTALDLRPEALEGLPVAHVGALDVRDEAAWEQAVGALALRSGGRLDLLVNNAGVSGAGFLEDLPTARLRLILDTNLLGPMLGVRAALPLLAATPDSQVALMGSMLGAHGAPQASAYAASKAGLRSLAESLSLELSRHGVGLVHLMPGFVDTPLLDGGSFSGEAVALPPDQLLSPEAVAGALMQALSGGPLHRPVGKDAGWMLFLARWWPGLVRWGMKREMG